MLIIIKVLIIILAPEGDLVEELKVYLISLRTAIVMVVHLAIRFNKLEMASLSHPNLITPIMEAQAIHHLKTEYRRNQINKKARVLETLVAKGCTILW